MRNIYSVIVFSCLPSIPVIRVPNTDIKFDGHHKIHPSLLHKAETEHIIPSNFSHDPVGYQKTKLNRFERRRLTKVVLYGLENGDDLVRIDQIDRKADLPEAPRPPDPVQVGLAVGSLVHVDGHVKVDDDRHLLDVDT